MADQNDKKRGRSLLEEVEIDMPEVKKLREDLLESFEDDDICTTSEDLDSFMKSFEEEISATRAPEVIDLTLDSGESRLKLGFLLEASDDELGLPPSEVTETARDRPDSEGLGELFGFEDRMASFDEFEFGLANGDSNEYVAIDGLFDYGDMGFGPADFGLQPETLNAQ